MTVEAMKQALEALENSIDDVRDCLNQNLPHAGYARYDRRIEWYREQITKHEEAITSIRQAIEQYEKQGPLEFSRGWDAGYNYAGMRFKNNFEQYLRIAITAAVEKAGAQTFKHSMNHYKNETCKE
jgi:hypothetical protein